jgi:hypothetical protein
LRLVLAALQNQQLLPEAKIITASLVGQPQQSRTANSETFTSPPVDGWQEAEVNVVNEKSLADHNFAPFSRSASKLSAARCIQNA